MKQEPGHVLINGIVSRQDFEPYLQIDIGGRMAQLSMAEARNVARDIERMCARTEADAMVHRFFAKREFPSGAGAALMIDFREFRSRLDAEEVDKTESNPEG